MVNRFVLAASLLAGVAASPAIAQEADQPVQRQDFIATMDANFAALDANGDGQVTAEEAMTAERQAVYNLALRRNQEIFGQLDRDGNGSLSAQEFALLVDAQTIPADPAPLLNQFDIDGNGAITLLEYRTRTQANFDRVDADRDGIITGVEMQAAGIPAQ